jgi:amino acid transporter
MHIWTRLLSCAAVLNVLVTYLSPLVPWTETPAGRATAMIAAMLLVTVVNVAGVRRASWTVNAFTIAKLLPLAFVIVLGCINLSPAVMSTQAVPELKWADAILLLIFGYGGFESGIVAGSESRDPKRDTAFALITAMVGITIIYCLVQLAVIGVLPDAASSKASVADALGVLIGPAGITLGSIAVIVSVYGWLTGYSLMSPRIFYSMAERGELPRILGSVHPEWRTPYVAIVVNSAIGLGLGLVSNFGQLATFSAISRLTIYITTCAALIALRRQRGMPEGFRAPGGPALALIGVAFGIWLLSTRNLEQAWFLPIVVVVGVAVWLGMRARGPVATTQA